MSSFITVSHCLSSPFLEVQVPPSAPFSQIVYNDYRELGGDPNSLFLCGAHLGLSFSVFSYIPTISCGDVFIDTQARISLYSTPKKGDSYQSLVRVVHSILMGQLTKADAGLLEADAGDAMLLVNQLSTWKERGTDSGYLV